MKNHFSATNEKAVSPRQAYKVLQTFVTSFQGIYVKKDIDPVPLCHCGYSRHKPFCDGTHERTDWDPALNGQPPLLHPNQGVIK